MYRFPVHAVLALLDATDAHLELNDQVAVRADYVPGHLNNEACQIGRDSGQLVRRIAIVPLQLNSEVGCVYNGVVRMVVYG